MMRERLEKSGRMVEVDVYTLAEGVKEGLERKRKVVGYNRLKSFVCLCV